MKKKVSFSILFAFTLIYSTVMLNSGVIFQIAGFSAKYASGGGKAALTAVAMGCNYLGGLAVSGVFTAPEGIALCCLGA